MQWVKQGSCLGCLHANEQSLTLCSRPIHVRHTAMQPGIPMLLLPHGPGGSRFGAVASACTGLAQVDQQVPHCCEQGLPSHTTL